MIDLAIPREPWWLDLPHGVRWHVRPLATALMLAAPAAAAPGEREAAGEAMDEPQRIERLAEALACEAIMAWEGVVAAGEPVKPSPETIAAVLERWPVFEAFRDGSWPQSALDAEKTADGPRGGLLRQRAGRLPGVRRPWPAMRHRHRGRGPALHL